MTTTPDSGRDRRRPTAECTRHERRRRARGATERRLGPARGFDASTIMRRDARRSTTSGDWSRATLRQATASRIAALRRRAAADGDEVLFTATARASAELQRRRDLPLYLTRRARHAQRPAAASTCASRRPDDVDGLPDPTGTRRHRPRARRVTGRRPRRHDRRRRHARAVDVRPARRRRPLQGRRRSGRDRSAAVRPTARDGRLRRAARPASPATGGDRRPAATTAPPAAASRGIRERAAVRAPAGAARAARHRSTRATRPGLLWSSCA